MSLIRTVLAAAFLAVFMTFAAGHRSIALGDELVIAGGLVLGIRHPESLWE